MARKARIHVAGIIQHIMARGIEGREIFAVDEDCTTFLHLLEESLFIAGHRCYAWVLMSNHYHLLLRSSDEPIGTMMRRLNSRYARYFSKKYNRRGYLFQDRYKSIATQDQNYIEELVRYIHLNPVRAGICKTMGDLDCYPWSGHAVIIGEKNVTFQDVGAVLKRFGESIERYRGFIEEGIQSESGKEITETIRMSNEGREDVRNAGCWVIGDSDFVQKTLASDRNRRARITRHKKEGWDVSRLADAISERVGIKPADMQKRSRDTAIADARKIFCYIGSKVLEMTKCELGVYLGISTPAVWRAAREGKKVMEKRGMNEFG